MISVLSHQQPLNGSRVRRLKTGDRCQWGIKHLVSAFQHVAMVIRKLWYSNLHPNKNDKTCITLGLACYMLTINKDTYVSICK
jgi:hypothetical protein